MGSITVDSSEWPLVRVTYVDTVDDKAFDAYVAQQVEVLDRREPYVILFDARRSGIPTARQRQKIAQFTKDREHDLKRYCKKGVFVIPNPLVRGALTAILWLQPLPFPHDVVASIEEAEKVLAVERRAFA